MSEIQHRQWEEWEAVSLTPSPEADELGWVLHQVYSRQVHVAFPSPKTNGAWEFTPQGWIGVFSISPQQTISIRPKVPINNVFRMWSLTQGRDQNIFLDQVVHLDADEELEAPLVRLLVERVKERLHRGLYRTYTEHHQRRPFVSGRIDIPRMVSTPWRVDVPCRTHEQTVDVTENQILAWTFHMLSRSLQYSPGLEQEVRKIYRQLSGCTSLQPFTPVDCRDRAYHRLNEDYELLHALCGFLLEFISPDHHIGDRPMCAFRIDMASLFERFVGSWLEKHLPDDLVLKRKVPLPFGGYEADMVLFDRERDRPLAVIDAKYKRVDTPAAADVHQVRSYAEAFGCEDSILVYPIAPKHPIDFQNRIRTRSAVFRLDRALDEAGSRLLDSLTSK